MEGVAETSVEGEGDSQIALLVLPIDNCKIAHPTITEHPFPPKCMWNTLQDPMLGRKTG